MAEKRMINKSISVSEKVNIGLTTIFAKLLFTWMIPHTDDFGRLAGSPAKIKALVVPMLDVTIREVEQALQDMHNNELIIWYEIEGDKYIQFRNFDEHQTGLHKRTNSKFPEFPGNSRNFTEIPSEGKGTEGNRTEQNRTEEEGNGMPDPDSNPHKNRIHKLINECEIREYNLHHLDVIFSYIGVVDIEVIESAIKKGQRKHINYTVNTLQGMVREGVKTKDQVLPKPDVGDAPPGRPAKPGKWHKPKLEVVKDEPKAPISADKLEEIRRLAREIDRDEIVNH